MAALARLRRPGADARARHRLCRPAHGDRFSQAGAALTLLGQIGPTLGTGYIVDAFLVVVLGGVGSLPGTVIAATLIGVFNAIFEMSTTATLGKVLVFVLIIAFLQWRPAGLVTLRSRA